ncbi:cytochrome P450 4AB4 precursor [Nasonia vitripennis]|uniref:Cytochrome P450 n=1 Tax=Nasonia vitripennis TaxID=7425 RepID=A0A7M6UDJ7_NASVI|nr:cytochrome P450 4AB4 precursor [Nasonia vitripennis]
MIVEFLLLLLLAACIFHYYTRCGRVAKLTENIPGVRAWPIVGSLPGLMKSQDELWPIFRKMSNDYYPTYKFWTTHEVVINIRHPDDIEILLSSVQHLEKSTAYKLLHPWLKTGLLTSAGNKWQARRKILTPAFHFNVLKKYMDIIVENSERMVRSLKTKASDGPIIDLLQFSTNYTLNVICETAMGTSLHGMEEFQEKYRNAIHKMGDVLIYRIARPWFRKESTFKWTQKGQEQTAALKVLHGFSEKIISERKEYHDQTKYNYLNQFMTDEVNDEEDNEIYGIRKKRLAMLDLLISLFRNGQIDDEGIQEEVDTFIFEGHDTAAMGLSFALLLLAEHTDSQSRARDEVKEMFNKSGGKMGYSEIQQLQYLEMCIKESLRLYPSVPFISRQLKKDLQLKHYLIPSGAIMHVHIYDLHRDANFWPEPEKYDPERFSPDSIRNRHPFSYIPFSAGPRNCIGQRFAMMELKASIAHLLHHFILEPIDYAHEVPIRSDLVIRPARPIRIKFVPIKHDALL